LASLGSTFFVSLGLYLCLGRFGTFVPRFRPLCLALGLLCLASGLCAFLRLLFGSSSDFLRASSPSSACVLFWCPDFCLMPLVLLYGNVAPSSSSSISIMFLFYFSTSLTLKILFGTYRAWLLNACFHHRGITIGSFQYSTDGLFAAATLPISMLHCIVQIMYIHTYMLNCTNDGFVLASDGDDVSLVVCSSCSMVRLLTLLGFGYWYW